MVSLQAALAAMALSAGGPTTMYDFYADWCGPCRAMSPTIDALIEKGYPVQKVNVDDNPTLAARYRAEDLPCYVMVVNGREVGRVVGGTSFARLEAMCKMALGGQSPAGPAAGKNEIPVIATGQNVKVEPDVAVAGEIGACVRLRIEDPYGYSCGSGTIIYARDGEALILTCGHIFRDSRGKGRIEVDLFGRQPARQISGRLVSYNLDSDVALVSIRHDGQLTAARVAPAGYRVGQGDPAVSIGCNHGQDPTIRQTRVLAVDRFVGPACEGPSNFQIDGQSVEGRSGGGLFSREGLVIGVCNAADPTDDASVYAALGAVHAELDRAELTHVYRPEDAPSPLQANSKPDRRSRMVAIEPPPVMPRRMPGATVPATAGAAVRPLTSQHEPRRNWIGADYDRRQCGVGPEATRAAMERFRPGSIR